MKIGYYDADLWPKTTSSVRRPSDILHISFQFLAHGRFSLTVHSQIAHKISSNRDEISLQFSDMTIFKMAVVRHLEFLKLEFFGTFDRLRKLMMVCDGFVIVFYNVCKILKSAYFPKVFEKYKYRIA